MTENDQKFKILFFFSQKIDFWSFFLPLNHPIYFVNIYFWKVLTFLRFWYKSFENRVKTQLPAFFFNFWNMNINKKYLNHCELIFYPIFKILAPKSSKKQVVLKKIYKKKWGGLRGPKNDRKWPKYQNLVFFHKKKIFFCHFFTP